MSTPVTKHRLSFDEIHCILTNHVRDLMGNRYVAHPKVNGSIVWEGGYDANGEFKILSATVTISEDQDEPITQKEIKP